MLAFLVGVPVILCRLGVVPSVAGGNPFPVLDNYAVMNRMWSISVFLSVVWLVVAVRIRNGAH